MINSATALPVGDAIALTLTIPADALYVRVLRKSSGAFTDPNDPNATRVYEGLDEQIVDIGVRNGITYYYKAYWWNGTGFEDDNSTPVSATPSSSYQDAAPDVRKILSDRMDSGFKQEIERGLLKIKPQQNAVRAEVTVLHAPPKYEETKWPVCSVHLASDASGGRTVGDELGDGIEGWMSDYTFTVCAWSQNPDERHALHKSMKRIIQANAGVFALFGIQEVDARFEDVDHINGEYPAAVYVCAATITCKAPAGVCYGDSGSGYAVIESVTVQPEVQVQVQTEE